MAHLLVSSETVIIDHLQDENVGECRSIGKHKRMGRDNVGLLRCSDGQAWPGGDNTKRRVLVSITNQPDKIMSTQSGKVFVKAVQRRPTKSKFSGPKYVSSSPIQPSSEDAYFVPTLNSFSGESGKPGELKPIGSEMNSRSDSSVSFSMAMSSSLRSMEMSFTLDSPMNVSSPDCYNSKLRCKEFIDIDLMEDSNCAITGEYAHSIFSYLREAEKVLHSDSGNPLRVMVRFHPNPHYMKQQLDITVSMRCILVDWLVEVADEFKLEQQTFYMALSIVDRFLSSMSVVRSKLQLVGGTAMYLASKFEEIFPPELAEFAYITDDTYTKAQIVRMERLILKVLDFNLAAPTAHNFLLRYLKASEVEQIHPAKISLEALNSAFVCLKDNIHSQATSQTIHCLSMYLCELALQDSDPYLKYYPSVIAASAVCLARHTTGQTAWPSILEHYSGYSVSDISNCVQDMHRSLALAPHHNQQAIRQKYSSHVFHLVSTIKAPETLPC